ncbi:COX15/CtaA family protein [Halobacteriales archaeon Cl-PHB]
MAGLKYGRSRRSTMRPRLRHLLAVTTGLTFVLILLGVYTGAMGAGLACAGRWPFCDGWLGLFPATWPSFLEWFHRFVAMITGFLILGSAVQAYRGDHGRRVLGALVFAVAVLPVQILLGANTIFNYGVLAQVTHHAAALLIFGAMVAGTAWAFEADDEATAVSTSADTSSTAD